MSVVENACQGLPWAVDGAVDLVSLTGSPGPDADLVSLTGSPGPDADLVSLTGSPGPDTDLVAGNGRVGVDLAGGSGLAIASYTENKWSEVSLSIPNTCILSVLYRVSHKKRNGGFLVHCELKVLHMFILLDRASSAEENGTNIVKFG